MKKYTSNEWTNASSHIYKTTADAITSFPATIIADGNNASAVVKGNMVQTGTPTPTTPIYPTECGDLSTGNYILPIISGGVTTNIDLSTVQTTRRIKKLVFDGTETVSSVAESTTQSGSYCFAFLYSNIGMTDIINYDADMRRIDYPYYISSHFVTKPAPLVRPNAFTDISAGQMGANTIKGGSTSEDWTFNRYIVFCMDSVSTITDFKAYLAQQYANGTPVTIWYMLGEPTTTTLNEPLRKIETYSDSVSVSALPTTAGSQTFNVDTILKPSEVDLTFKGWHDITDHKYTSGAWDTALRNEEDLREQFKKVEIEIREEADEVKGIEEIKEVNEEKK